MPYERVEVTDADGTRHQSTSLFSALDEVLEVAPTDKQLGPIGICPDAFQHAAA
jgi:hypothetical protein